MILLSLVSSALIEECRISFICPVPNFMCFNVLSESVLLCEGFEVSVFIHIIFCFGTFIVSCTLFYFYYVTSVNV